MCRANIASQKPRRRKARSGTGGSGDRASINYRSRSGDVQEHIVIGRVIRNAKPATNNRLVAFHPEEVWIVSESDVGAEIFVVIGDLRKRRYRAWQRRIPEWIGTRLICYRQIVKEIDCLARKFPAQPE